ncbi:DUF6053 domain-containing protein [Lysobacter enzymogenes]|uniref:DUF6053 domain-containing protein n=1 Tax=Lysobacter enzymogenes TaxID=69 RepID=UPI0037490C3F
MFFAFAGGPSGPMLLFPIAANRAQGIGPEGPPANAQGPRARALRSRFGGGGLRRADERLAAY